MNLFQLGDFKLHTGQKSRIKIDCDALTNDDIEAIAFLISNNHFFGRVVGIPRGGLRLAAALEKYNDSEVNTTLVVDDVFTTGRSMNEKMAQIDGRVTGCVIFARCGILPSRVTAVFQSDMFD